MSDKRKLKKKGKNDAPPPTTNNAPSKLEKAVADYMRSKVPIKKTRFINHQVNYFNANKAIDVLLDSPWATGKEPIFTTRESVVDFGNKLLIAKFFHRAKKLAVTDKDLSPKELKKKQERQKRKEKKGEDTGTETPNKDEEEDNHEDKDKQKKKRTKIKLDMHLDQVFVDSSDAYVWMYEPVPFWYFIAGGCLLFAAVAVCLFPLWPPMVRNGVYYLCVAAAGFLGFILGLAVLRLIVFMIIWTLSFSRHHLWILPNLTEDVGFFASFWPLYHYEYKGDAFSKKNKSKKKETAAADETLEKSEVEPLTEQQNEDGHKSDQSGVVDETDSSEASNSQTFEMVDKDDVRDGGDSNSE